MRSKKDIQHDIDILKKGIAEFEKEKLNIPPNIKMAEILHQKLCRHNHTDMCDWYYGNWEEPLNYSRKRYLEKADELLNEDSFETIKRIIGKI